MADTDTIQTLADSPELVLPVYALVLTPLALYVYHDILDRRWRPVWRLSRYLVAYIVLYIFSGSALVYYIIIQARYGHDFKEVGASALALILGTYGAWRLVRLTRIIIAHHSLVKILQRIDRSLAAETGLQPVGMEYHLFRHPKTALPSRLKYTHWRYETRHDFISSALFDDDYPGDTAARIRWLALFGKRVVVLQDDAEECASRVALWMRLVLRRPRSEPWRLLTSTSPLVQGQLYRPGLGEALRALITNGSGKQAPPHANLNPAELLLNKLEKGGLTETAIGFFWIGSEMASEEMAQVLAEMPPRWMRGVTQNGKQLMFELVMSLILCEMPEPEDTGVQWLLSLPILEWRKDVANIKVWSALSEICADAVCSVLPEFYTQTKRLCDDDDEVYRIVRDGVFALQEATSSAHGFQGDIVGLSLIELVRTSYRSGYVAEQILGKALEMELSRQHVEDVDARIYKAEVATGLFSILQQLGQDDSDEFRDSFSSMKSSWGVDERIEDVFFAIRERAKQEMRESFHYDEVAQSRCWYLSDRRSQCEDPVSAFGAGYSTAMELAPLVVQMLRHYSEHKPEICVQKGHSNSERNNEQWMRWKQIQAYDLSGSAEGLDADTARGASNGKGSVVVTLW
ncbi:unnamed protein product [Agarophyton chilense]